MAARFAVLVAFRAWCYLGAAGVSLPVLEPAVAGVNEWTSSHVPNSSCDTDGVPSLEEALACHENFDAHDLNPLFTECGEPWVRVANFNDVTPPINYNALTVQDYDTSSPYDCAVYVLLGGHHASWSFTETCSTLGKEWNSTYGGCVEICIAPETLNTETGECGPPSSPPTPRHGPNGGMCKGNPCDVLSGNKIEREVDYAPASGMLSFTRTYNGLTDHVAKQGQFGSPLGKGWFASYLQYLSAPTGLNSATVSAVRPGGDVITFTATLPGSTATQYQAQGELEERLVVVTNASGGFIGWLYVTANDDEELYNTNGRLLAITSRAGVAQTLAYGENNRVASVIDDFGHELAFQWDTAWPPRLTSVVLPGSGSGQIVFAYGANNNLTRVTYPDTRTREYLYELAGAGQENLLTGIEDESGVRYATWEYGDGNLVTSSVHAGGVDRYSITYNTDGTRVVVDPLGTSFTYSSQVIAGQRRYTGSNLLCQGCGEYASATFDMFGNFESKVDFGGIETRFTHDTARTLETSRTEAYGTPRARTISTVWHPIYRLPTLVNEPGRTTGFDYDANGNLLEHEVTDTATSAVRRTMWTYDTYGRVLTADGPRTDATDVTTFAYYTCGTGNECGQLQSITNALSQVTTYDSYNAHGQPLQITDPNGVVTTLTYDARQRLTSRTVAGEQTQIEYWPTGLLKKVTLPDGSFLLYTYDNAHRLTRIDDEASNYVVYTLDGMGNRTAENVYDPATFLRRTRSSVFNSLNQLWKDLTAAGTAAQTTEFGYDTRGNQTAINAPLGRNTVNVFDELGRLTQMTDTTEVTELGYDANDNLTSVTDPRDNVTSYTYNGFDDLLTQTSPDTGLTTNTYDSRGNLVTSTDARNAITTYSYDALNRVTSAAFTIGTTTDRTIAFTYDAGTFGKGRRTGVSDASHSMTWVYDALGRVTSKTQTVGTVATSVGYGYTNGNRTSLTTPSGQSVAYGYNTNGQVISITINGTALLSGVTYEPFGSASGWTWGNLASVSREYNTDGNVTEISSAELRTYSYDDALRITSTSNSTHANLVQNYQYDLADRLTSVTGPWVNSTLTYDANGNRLGQGGYDAATYAVETTSNRLLSVSGDVVRTYAYDAAGNPTTDGGIAFTYDNAGRLTSASKAGVTTTYVTNGLGQRVRKTAPSGSTYFVYDEAGHLIGEYDDSGNLIQETVWLGDIPVGVLRPAGGGVDVFFVHTDHLNAPTKITRPSDNAVVWRWYHDPFGVTLREKVPPRGYQDLFEFNLRLPGQYFDAETGLHYNYFRDYDAVTGRYIQSDPIGLSGGVNTYGYVAGNPVSLIDPAGLDWIDYTGTTVNWYGGNVGDTRHLFKSCPATSGMVLSQNPMFQNRPEGHPQGAGPIPAGLWRINLVPNPERWATYSRTTGDLDAALGIQRVPRAGLWQGGIMDFATPWGQNRARLEAVDVPNAYGRGNFYLHDSNKGYTNGCVESCSDLFQRLAQYRSAGNTSIDFRVRYTGNITYGGTGR